MFILFSHLEKKTNRKCISTTKTFLSLVRNLECLLRVKKESKENHK